MPFCICIHFSGYSVPGTLGNGYTEFNETQPQGLQKPYLVNVVNPEGEVQMTEVEERVCAGGRCRQRLYFSSQLHYIPALVFDADVSNWYKHLTLAFELVCF